MRSSCNNLQVSTGKCLVANQPKSSHAGYRYRALLSEWIAKNWSLTITKFSCNNLRVAPTGKCYVANQPKSSDGVGVSAAVIKTPPSNWMILHWDGLAPVCFWYLLPHFNLQTTLQVSTGKCYVANQPKSSHEVGVSAAVRQYGSVSLGRSACEVLRVFERDSCDLCAWLLTVIESERLFWERISRTSSKLR